MKNLLFLLAFLPTIGFAEGPLFRQKEPSIQLEIENIYQDIRRRLSNLNISSGTITNLNVSSITWAGSGYTQRFHRFVNVKDYGAVGNGTTSDTAPIERAMADGVNIYFPGSLGATVYLTTSTLKPRNYHTFFGDGPEATVIQGDNLTSAVIGTPGASREFITIRDMRIDNKSSSTVGGIGIRFSTVSHSVIRNVYISRVSTGIVFSGASNFYDKVYDTNISEIGTGVINDSGSNDQSFYSVRINNGNTGYKGAGVTNWMNPSIEIMSGNAFNILPGGRTNVYGARIDDVNNGFSIEVGADYTLNVEPQFTTIGTSEYAGDTTKLMAVHQGQIRFPSTQNPSTNVNTLDDYEEGTWTPSVGGNATYTNRSGHYVKIGKQVHLTGLMEIATLGTGSTTRITNAPFVNVSTTMAPGSVGYWSSLATNVLFLTCRMQGSSNQIAFTAATAAGTTATDEPAIFGNNARVDFSVSYKVTD